MRFGARPSRFTRLTVVLAMGTVFGACQSSRSIPVSVARGAGLQDRRPLVRCEVLVQEIARREGLSPAASALVAQSLALHGGTVVRWPAMHRPLRVWLQAPAAEGDTLTAARTNAARHGALDWNGATAAVQLAVSADSAQAHIVVVWTPRFAPGVRSTGAAPAGRSGAVRSAATGEIEHATVVLAVHTSTGLLASPRDLHAMAIHEVGHALGLAHSPSSATPRSSVMAAVVATDDVTASDRAALHAWYTMAAGRACDDGQGAANGPTTQRLWGLPG